MERINIECSEYFSILQKSFDDLENCLLHKFNNTDNVKKTVTIAQYEEAIGLLTIEKSNLEQQLLKKNQECYEWHDTCLEILNKLSLVIESIKSILSKVGKEYKQQ